MTISEIIVPGITLIIGLFLLLFPNRWYSFLLEMKRDSNRLLKGPQNEKQVKFWIDERNGKTISRIIGIFVTIFALFMWFILFLPPSNR